MDRRQKVIVVLVVAVGGAVLWARHYFAPEQVVTRKVAATAAALEKEAILGVMSRISRSYSDPWGGSYESLAGAAQQMVDEYEDLDFGFDVVSAESGDGWVRLWLRFTLAGTSTAGREAILGSLGDPCSATVVWHKEPPGWRLTDTEELDIPGHRAELERRRNRTAQ